MGCQRNTSMINRRILTLASGLPLLFCGVAFSQSQSFVAGDASILFSSGDSHRTASGRPKVSDTSILYSSADPLPRSTRQTAANDAKYRPSDSPSQPTRDGDAASQFPDALDFSNLLEAMPGDNDDQPSVANSPYVPPGARSNNEFPVHPAQANQVYDAQTTTAGSLRSTPTAQPHAFPPMNQPVAAQRLDSNWANDSSIPRPAAEYPFDRPRILFRPVVTGVDSQGRTLLRPSVQLAGGALVTENLPSLRLAQHHEEIPTPPPASPAPSTNPAPPINPAPETIPEPDIAYPVEQEWMPPVVVDDCSSPANSSVGPLRECWYTLLASLNGPRACPSGVGPEHVMNALFFLDTTQPLNNCRVRLDAGYDWEFPDRAEYFWAKTPGGRGPIDPVSPPDDGEPAVDYQDIRFYIERGGDRFSVGTELPIRSVDPELRLNSTGLADMNLTTKALLLDGKCWQLSQIFRTYFPTGSAHRGTGNGHFSLEPGVAARYKWSDVTYFHGDLSYWFPIAGDLDQSGQILNAGIGISHVLVDTDSYAVIPTFELDSWTVLDGQQTAPFAPAAEEIDTVSIVNLHPGVRFVCDKGCDCGTKEFGIASGIAVTEDQFYSAMIRIEFRWTH